MILLSMISFLFGALLGQRFKVMVLMPAMAIVLILAVGTGVMLDYTAWLVVLTAAAASTSLQIGYLIGLGIHHVLMAAPSGRSSPLTSHTGSTPARHPAH